MKKWTKPQSTVELLERSLARARDEEKWAIGQWCSPSTQALDAVAFDSGDKTDAFWEQECQNAPACAMGIILLEGLDGKFFREYVYGRITGETAIRSDAMCSEAVMLLAQALDATEYEYEYKYVDDAISHVMDINDHPPYVDNEGGFDRQAHHARIVAGFEKAVELAKGAIATP
jgi:hypothetical protein